MTTNRRSQILDSLRSRGIPHQLDGKYIRCVATWRGGKNYSVAINAETGSYNDFAAGESGGWRDFAAVIGADAGEREWKPREEWIAAQRAKEAADAAELSERKARGLAMLDTSSHQVWQITAAPISDQHQAYASFLAGKKTRRGGLNNDTATETLQPYEFLAGLRYLESRGNGVAFAAAAGALVGKKKAKQSLDGWAKWGGWEIRWPLFEDGTAKKSGVQRERGRGDVDEFGNVNKAMKGLKEGCGTMVPPLKPSKMLAIGEGMQTLRAAWNHLDCHALIKYDAGNLGNIEIQKWAGYIDEHEIDTIYLLCDHDREKSHTVRLASGEEIVKTTAPAGQKACQAAAEAILLTRPDLAVKIAMPVTMGEDWDDVEARTTPEDFKAEFFASLADPLPPEPTETAPQPSYKGPAYSLRAGTKFGGGGGTSSHGDNVVNLAWTRKMAEPTMPPEETGLDIDQAAEMARQEIRQVVDNLAEPDRKPIAFSMPPGVGKTAQTVEAVITSNSCGPLLIATPRLTDVAAIAKTFDEASIPFHVHERRNKETCNKIDDVAKVAEAKRSPFAWECQLCPDGTMEKINDGTACKYMQNLQTAKRTKILLTTHAAIEDDSSLLSYTTGEPGNSENQVKRAIIIDEEINRVAPLEVFSANFTQVELLTAPALMILDNKINAVKAELGDVKEMQNLTRNQRKMVALMNKNPDTKAREDKLKLLKEYEDARTWLREVTPALKDLQIALSTADATKWVKIDGEKFDKLKKLLGKTKSRSRIPTQAISNDGTILEDVAVARMQRLDIPASWLKALGQALSEGNAWFFGGKITGGYTSKLWERFLKEGGINLDATPSLRAIKEIEAAGGRIVNIKVAAPMLSVVQWGPTLCGRRFDKSNMDKAMSRLLPILEGQSGDVCVITHKPIAEELIAKRPDLIDFIGYWGNDEKAHNRWEKCKKMVIYGLPLTSPNEAVRAYAIDCNAMAAKGIEWKAWSGEVIKHAWIEIAGGKEVQSAAPLPDVADARAWLLDKMAAQTAQAVGRLRGVRRTEQVTVDIFGAIPLKGHGIEIAEAHLAPGRMSDRATRTTQVAAAIVHLIDERAEMPTRRDVADYLTRESNCTPSSNTIDKIMAALRRAALSNRVTIAKMCRMVRDDLFAEWDLAWGLGHYERDAAAYRALASESVGAQKDYWLAVAEMRCAIERLQEIRRRQLESLKNPPDSAAG
jgi:hypothetical protein